MARMYAVLVPVILAGCLDEPVQRCEDGTLCPAASTCIPGGCVGPAFCGDNRRSAGEECEDTDHGGRTCEDFGFYGGDLTCTDRCALDTAGCVGACGDGTINGPEQCDGPIIDGCNALGFDLGRPACTAECAQSLEPCAYLGWRVADPNRSFDGVVWGTGATDVWISGRPAQHFDGVGWDYVPFDVFIAAIHGTAPDDVWLLGVGVAHHWDGAAWTEESIGANDMVFDAWALADGTLLAATTNGVRRRTGGVWSAMPAIGSGAGVNAVWGTAADNVYAGTGTGLYRWNGASWTRVVTGNFDDIWGSGPDDIYAIVRLTELHHWDGNTWTPIALGEQPQAVWGSGPDDVYVTGFDHLFHWDGRKWWAIDPPPESMRAPWTVPGALYLATFGGGGLWRATHLWEVDPTRPVARDIAHTGTALWVRSVAEVWRDGVPVALPPSFVLVDLWAGDEQHVFVLGDGGRIAHYDGNVFVEETSPVDTALRTIHGSADGTVIAVGASGVALHRRAGVWEPEPTGTTEYLQDVQVLGPAAAMAVGGYGTALWWNGTAWSATSPGSSASLIHVWGQSATDLIAYGSSPPPVQLSWDGAAWTVATQLEPPIIEEVWGGAAGDAWGVSTTGFLQSDVFRWDGLTWLRVPQPSGAELSSVHVAPDGTLYVGGNLGVARLLVR